MSVDISFKPKTKRRFADSPAIRAKRKASLEARIAAFRKAHYRCSDAGRAAWSKTTGIRETRDCTVRALAVAGNVSYGHAHDLMAKVGRRPRRRSNATAAITKFTNFKTPTVGVSGQVWRVVPNLGPGRWIVSVRGHVFAVVDGTVHDLVIPLRYRVLAAFRIDGMKPEGDEVQTAESSATVLAAGAEPSRAGEHGPSRSNG